MTDIQEKLKGEVTLPSDIRVKRTSPTIARQELLAHFRILNRTCFNGQFQDPFIHMIHDLRDGLTAPMTFWINERGGFQKPTISISKEKLMALDIEEMFQELCEMAALYWLHKEGEQPSKEHPQYQTKVAYINEHATTSFLGIHKQEQVADNADRRNDTQRWVDENLKTLEPQDLRCIALKLSSLDEPQRRAREKIFEYLKTLHEQHINNLPTKLRFNAPTTSMISRRALELHEEQTP